MNDLEPMRPQDELILAACVFAVALAALSRWFF